MITDTIERLSGYIEDAYAALSSKNASIPEQHTAHNLSSTIDTIPTGQKKEHYYALTSTVEWNDEWEQRCKEGSIYDLVVGDDKAPLLSVKFWIANINANDPCTIDWGDGTSTTMLKVSYAFVYHTYENPGHYVMKVDDKISRIYVTGSVPLNNSIENRLINNTRFAIRRLRQVGSRITNMYCHLFQCQYANSEEGGYPGVLPPIPPNVLSIEAAFSFLRYYRYAEVPRIDNLSVCTNCRMAFCEMENSPMEAQKLPVNCRSAEYMYGGCQKIKKIPYDIFSQANDLTNINTVFLACYTVEGEYPALSNLTKLKCASSTFYACWNVGKDSDLPELPYAPDLTSIGGLFAFNYCATGSNNLDIPSHLPNVKNMTETFYNCQNMRISAELPDSIAKDGFVRTYMNCYSLYGEHPQIPMNYVGSLYGIFNGCTHLSGQIKPIPPGANYFYCAYQNNLKATGKFPDLSQISSINGSNAFTNMFSYCIGVTQQPDNFLNPAVVNAGTGTDFNSMFSKCRSLSSFDHCLSVYTKPTTCTYMFSECYNLRRADMTIPANCTNASNMFYACYELTSNMRDWSSMTKLTNATNMYYQCLSLGLILDESGAVLTDPDKIYNSKITGYSSMVAGTAGKLQKQIYDALTAKGKSGGLWGAVNATWD